MKYIKARNEGKTTKKVKFEGTKPFLDTKTGEIMHMNVTEIQDADYNFHKMFLSTLIAQLEEMSNVKTKVAFYLLEKMKKHDNTINTNQSKIAKELNISRTTVNEAFKILLKTDFMRKIDNNTYMVNANSVVSGDKNKRNFILIKYEELENELYSEDSQKRAELKTKRKKRIEELSELKRDELLKILGLEKENAMTECMEDAELIGFILRKEFKEDK